MAAPPKKVLVTGAAGQIGYSLVNFIAKGDVFGPQQPVILVLLDIAPMMPVLEGVVMELNDCAFPLLAGVVPTSDEAEAFKDVEAAFLVGAMPRKEGMERKDLLAANVKIFKSQGQSLAKHGNPNCKVIVVGNPANTNAYICAKYAAPTINPRNISAMTRLDHNRATAQVAARTGVSVTDVDGVIIWGNHSSTQFPDLTHATVNKGGKAASAYEAVGDEAWIKGDFISTVQKRGAAVISKRKLSSAMSAAKAAGDHIHDWFAGTGVGARVRKAEGEPVALEGKKWVSMAVASDGSYGIPEGIVYSFPVTIAGGEWSIVKGLAVDDFAKEKQLASLKELQEEAADAMAACSD